MRTKRQGSHRIRTPLFRLSILLQLRHSGVLLPFDLFLEARGLLSHDLIGSRKLFSPMPFCQFGLGFDKGRIECDLLKRKSPNSPEGIQISVQVRLLALDLATTLFHVLISRTNLPVIHVSSIFGLESSEALQGLKPKIGMC